MKLTRSSHFFSRVVKKLGTRLQILNDFIIGVVFSYTYHLRSKIFKIMIKSRGVHIHYKYSICRAPLFSAVPYNSSFFSVDTKVEMVVKSTSNCSLCRQCTCTCRDGQLCIPSSSFVYNDILGKQCYQSTIKHRTDYKIKISLSLSMITHWQVYSDY